jgi:CTP:molybdopterin cytidylyltransferase MocA
MSGGWTAILLAGQRPGVDPLASVFGQTWKALVPVGGQAMLSRVAGTLLTSPSIDRIVVLAQEPEALFTGDCAWMKDEPRIATAASETGIAHSIARIAGAPIAPWPVLITTADHPLLTAAMIEMLIDRVGTADVAVGVVSRRVLLAAYPNNHRTWLRFADGGWTGANLFALRTERARRALGAWAEVERDRKKAFKLIWHFGPLLALRALTRTITLRAAMLSAGWRLGFYARPVPLPFAEAGIDVDKTTDHALAEQILRERGA